MKVGKHKITTESIIDLDFNQLLEGNTIDILYSDPPWGNGNLKYWVTINKKQTGKDFKVISYDELLNRFKTLIKTYTKGYVFIECSVKDLDALEQALGGVLTNIKKFVTRYPGGKNGLFIGGTEPRFNFTKDMTGATGFKQVNDCISSCPGEIVCDPTCGYGWTAKAAIKNGKTFIGNEFNKIRAERTIKELQKDGL